MSESRFIEIDGVHKSFPDRQGGTFVALLVGTVILVGALTYLPALALGPIVEHFQLQGLQTK